MWKIHSFGMLGGWGWPLEPSNVFRANTKSQSCHFYFNFLFHRVHRMNCAWMWIWKWFYSANAMWRSWPLEFNMKSILATIKTINWNQFSHSNSIHISICAVFVNEIAEMKCSTFLICFFPSLFKWKIGFLHYNFVFVNICFRWFGPDWSALLSSELTFNVRIEKVSNIIALSNS